MSQQVPQSQQLTVFKNKIAQSPKNKNIQPQQILGMQNAASLQNLQQQNQAISQMNDQTSSSLSYLHAPAPNNNMMQNYTQANHYLSVNPSQISMENSTTQSTQNLNSGILAHRNSHASLNACNTQHTQQNASLNTSNIHRKLKQSPNIVRDNKLFPNDFFLNQPGIAIIMQGSPNSKQTLQSTAKNTRIRQMNSHCQLYEESDEDNMIDEQNNQQIQKIPIVKANTNRPENVPSNNPQTLRRFKFPEEEDENQKGKGEIKLKLSIKKRKRDNSQNTQQKSNQDSNFKTISLKNQKQEQQYMSPSSRRQNFDFSQQQNQENLHYLSNIQKTEEKPFDGLKTQVLNLSIDSDKIKKYGLQAAVQNAVANSNLNQQSIVNSISKHSRKANLPFGSIDHDKKHKINNNVGGSPQVGVSMSQNNREFSRNNEFLTNDSNQSSINRKGNTFEQQMRSTQSQFTYHTKGTYLPELTGSVNRNSYNNIENHQEFNFGKIPNLNETSLLQLSSNRQNHSNRVPIFMRHSIQREDLDQIQNHNNQNSRFSLPNGGFEQNSRDMIQDENSQSYINMSNNQNRYRNPQANKDNDTEQFYMNGASPQSLNVNDVSNSQIHSNGKQSVNSSTLLNPNQNHHHYWNRSPQILKDLDSHQHLNNQPLYFPQSTRNYNASRSPSHGFSGQGFDKTIKFPNIFNHNSNNQSQLPNSSQINSSQASQVYHQQNQNTTQISQSSNNNLSLYKKGKIAVDHNYQVIKNQPNYPTARQSLDNSTKNQLVIHERKETSESERSYKDDKFNQIQKGKIDRKMLTSRDQDDRWLKDEQTDRRMGRNQSKSNLEKNYNKNDLIEGNDNSKKKGSSKKVKNSPFSQSGKCWYNSPKINQSNGITTFGQSPDLSNSMKQETQHLSRIKRRKEDQPRHSLPENKAKNIQIETKETAETMINSRTKSRQEINRNRTKNNSDNEHRLSGRITYQELETPHFKQFGIPQRNSIVQNTRENMIDQAFSQQYHTDKNKSRLSLNNRQVKNALNEEESTQNQEVMPFDFNPNHHDIFDEDLYNTDSKLTPNQSSVMNLEYAGSPVDACLEDMRHSELREQSRVCQQSSPAHYDNPYLAEVTSQNQLVQPASLKGNVEPPPSMNRSPDGHIDSEVRKFKVISKSKKKEKEFITIPNNIQQLSSEDKSKLIKHLEKNLKRLRDPGFSRSPQNEQQEQIQVVQKATLDHSPSSQTLQIKEGNSSNVTSQNNSQLQKKIPLIKKSQIQNTNKQSEGAQKVNIVKTGGTKPNQNSNIGITERQIIPRENAEFKFKQDNKINDHNLANQKQQYYTNQNNIEDQQIRQVERELSNDRFQTSTFKQLQQMQQTSSVRHPLQELENKNSSMQNMNSQKQFMGYNSFNSKNNLSQKNSNEYEQTPSFNFKQPSITQHINQIYMAAQIPQEFNGMITFMNIHHHQQLSSDNQKSNSQESNQHGNNSNNGANGDIDPFKNTGGSLMRGTILSLTTSTNNNQNFNATLNPTTNGQQIGQNLQQQFMSTVPGTLVNQGNPGSQNNSIVLLRSESNYMTSDFGGQGKLMTTSPLSTQHLVIMQQQIIENQQMDLINHSNQVDDSFQRENEENIKPRQKDKKQNNVARDNSFKKRQNQNKENQFINANKQDMNSQNQNIQNLKLEFQNSKIKKAAQNNKIQPPDTLRRVKETENKSPLISIQ